MATIGPSKDKLFWKLSGTDVDAFICSEYQKFLESPCFFCSNLKFSLFIYPRGCYHNEPYCEIFIVSKGELPPKAPDEVHLHYTLHCSLQDTKWNETIVLNKDENGNYHYQLPTKLHTSYIQTLLYNKPKTITFRCEIKYVNEQQNDLNHSIPQNIHHKEPTKQSNDQQNEQKSDSNFHPCSKQTIITKPSFDQSDIERLSKDSFIWMIPQNEIQKFRQTKQGYFLDSPEFECMNGSKWSLSVYPNGTKDKKDSVALYVRCCQYPLNVEMLTVLFDAYLMETDTHSSNSFNFGHNRNDFERDSIGMWHPFTVHSNQLKYAKDLTFRITLTVVNTVLSVNNYNHQHNNMKQIGFIRKIQRYRPMRRMHSVQWIIPINKAFYDPAYNKTVTSQRFDIWALRCLPNGDNEGRVKLQLYLVAGPAALEVEYSLKCKEFDILWKERTKFEIDKGQNTAKYREWKDINLYNEQLHNLKQITFECSIHILHQFDKRGREIFEYNDLSAIDCGKDEEKKENENESIRFMKEQTEQMKETKQKMVEFEKENVEIVANQKNVNEELNRLKLNKKKMRQNVDNLTKSLSKMKTKIINLENLTKNLQKELNEKNQIIENMEVFKKEMNIKIDDFVQKYEKRKEKNVKKEESLEQKQTKQKWLEFSNKYDNMFTQMMALEKRITNTSKTNVLVKSEHFKKTFDEHKEPGKISSSEEEEEEQEGGMNVKGWLCKELRLPQYVDLFLKDGWDDFDNVKTALNEEHLRDMKIIKTGHRVKIMRAIQLLRQQKNTK